MSLQWCRSHPWKITPCDICNGRAVMTAYDRQMAANERMREDDDDLAKYGVDDL